MAKTRMLIDSKLILGEKVWNNQCQTIENCAIRNYEQLNGKNGCVYCCGIRRAIIAANWLVEQIGEEELRKNLSIGELKRYHQAVFHKFQDLFLTGRYDEDTKFYSNVRDMSAIEDSGCLEVCELENGYYQVSNGNHRSRVAKLSNLPVWARVQLLNRR